MADPYLVAVEGLSDLGDLDEITPAVERAALRAVNLATRKARTRSSKEMRNQVAFSARYLSGNAGRLAITETARRGSLQATITGRARPTSLARFTVGGQTRRGRRVQVKPGVAKRIGRSFVMNLRNGNKGLAVRTDGSPPRGAYKPKKLSENLYLLYGPSVDQVFRTVSEDVSDDAAADMEQEFGRLMNLEDL
jgi:hypothetical protein